MLPEIHLGRLGGTRKSFFIGMDPAAECATPQETWVYHVGSRPWSDEETAVLHQALAELDGRTDISMVQAYVKIAARLPDKTVRDVAAHVSALRNNTAETADLAASAMGAAAAVAGLSVPGVNPATDTSGAIGFGAAQGVAPAEAVAAAAAAAAQNGGSWDDPAAMFTGPSSIRSTMHPQSGMSGSDIGSASVGSVPPPVSSHWSYFYLPFYFQRT